MGHQIGEDVAEVVGEEADLLMAATGFVLVSFLTATLVLETGGCP